MGRQVLDAVCSMFGSGGSAKSYLSEWMTTVLEALLIAFQGNLLSGALDIFAAIACSLLIIYFFMDLSSQASRDMFSFEKLIVAFIKFFVAFAVLLCLKEIMTGILSVGYKLFQMLETQAITLDGSETFEPTFMFDTSITVTRENLYVGSETYNKLKPIFEEQYSGFDSISGNIGLFVSAIILDLASKILKLVGYFLVTSCALQIIIKGFISPIAVVQMFEDGTRSVGARHIKSFAAECITMAMMILILTASEALVNLFYTLGDPLPNITFDSLGEIVSGNALVKTLLPQLAAIGGLMGAGRLSKEIVGA